MKVLLDTCILSEINKPEPEKSVISTISELEEQDIFTSVICIGEIRKGVELLANGKRKDKLNSWLINFEKYYSNRILRIDLEIVNVWGKLTANAQKSGRIISATDGLIAATGIKNNLSVMTRNVKDFELSGASIVNPWEREI